MRARFVGAVLAVIAVACSASSDANEPVLILVAASTVDAVEEIAVRWEEQTGRRVDVSAGPSSTLSTQIRFGAPAGLFLSAHPHWVYELSIHGRGVDAEKPLLTNRLVIVVPTDSAVPADTPPSFLLHDSIARVALADGSVPAGIYAREALERTGIAEQVDAKAVRAVDVRAALAWVERGEADAGIVYATDVAASRGRVRIVHEYEPGERPIRYVLATIGGADERARAFAEFLGGDEAASIFAAHGFERVTR